MRMPASAVVLFLGGARSGKSRLAQARAEARRVNAAGGVTDLQLQTGSCRPVTARSEPASACVDHSSEEPAPSNLECGSGGTVPSLIYIAPAVALDDEMTERIARHRADRGPRWRTVEEPLDVPGAVAREARADRVVLVDCLTLWLSNLMLGQHDVLAATDRLIEALGKTNGTVLLVANEVGLGIVPENALARRFRDEAGRLNQRVAAVADEVLLVAAGLALRMK